MGNPSFARLRVLDLSRYLPGGYATQVLADLGADVIKVEDTGLGDFCRHEHPQRGGMSYYIEALGRNKRSVALDLKDADAHAAFMKLVKGADVVVESFRPGVTKKLGIDYAAVRAVNPRIVYCSFSGYGQDDPRSQLPLHDLNMQAQSGYLSLNGGVKAPLHLCDLASSMVAAQSMLAALYDREISGEGRFIDVSMFDSFVWWNSLIDTRWGFQDESISEDTIAFPERCCFYNIYETSDGGRLAFGLIEDKFWASFCEDAGVPELIDQPDDAYERMCALVGVAHAGRMGGVAGRQGPVHRGGHRQERGPRAAHGARAVHGGLPRLPARRARAADEPAARHRRHAALPRRRRRGARPRRAHRGGAARAGLRRRRGGRAGAPGRRALRVVGRRA